MIKNKKAKKILSRFLAVLGVVVILVSAVAFPSSAWEVTDIPFYNYVDCSVLHTTLKDEWNAYISDVDTTNDIITMKAQYQGAKYYYVPSGYLNITLGELCPEMKVGETYVLSGEYLDGNYDALSYRNMIFLYNADYWVDGFEWSFGSSLTVEQKHLDARVMFWFADYLYSGALLLNGQEGTMQTRQLRIWVNKDEARDYAPHNIFADFIANERENIYNEGKEDGLKVGYEEAYKEGFEQGADEGYQEYITRNLLVSKENMMIQAEYRRINNGNASLVYGGLERGFDYPYNGYTFNTDHIPEKYINSSLGALVGWRITCIPLQYGQYYVVGDSDLTLTGNEVRVLLRVRLETDAEGVYHQYIYDFDDGREVITVDWVKDFGLKENDEISSIYFHVESYLPLLETVTFEPFTFAFADQNAYDFKIGKEEGKTEGVLEGIEQGKVIGREEGFEEGKLVGKEEGFKEGHTKGYETGVKDGKEQGVMIGEMNGYEDGYYQGRADENAQSSFGSLISAVVDTPIRAFQSLFNFEIMGVNLSNFALALITLCLVVAVVKFIL